MPRDRRPNKTPSSAAIVEASKLQTINAFEENKMMNILKSYNIKRYILQGQLSVFLTSLNINTYLKK